MFLVAGERGRSVWRESTRRAARGLRRLCGPVAHYGAGVERLQGEFDGDLAQRG